MIGKEAPQPPVEIELPEERREAATNLRFQFERWSSLVWNRPPDTPHPDLTDPTLRWDNLMDTLHAELDAQPEVAVPILEIFAASEDLSVRCAAAMNLDRAYFADPERAHSLIAQLLADDHGTVRDKTRIALSEHASHPGWDRPEDARGSVSLDYLKTLPIDRFYVRTDQDPHYPPFDVYIEREGAETFLPD